MTSRFDLIPIAIHSPVSNSLVSIDSRSDNIAQEKSLAKLAKIGNGRSAAKNRANPESSCHQRSTGNLTLSSYIEPIKIKYNKYEFKYQLEIRHATSYSHHHLSNCESNIGKVSLLKYSRISRNMVE